MNIFNELQFVTVKEAASILKVSIYTVIRYLKAGHLKGEKLPTNSQWRVDYKSIKRCLRKND